MNVSVLLCGVIVANHRGQGAGGAAASMVREPNGLTAATSEAFPIKKGSQQLQKEEIK